MNRNVVLKQKLKEHNIVPQSDKTIILTHTLNNKQKKTLKNKGGPPPVTVNEELIKFWADKKDKMEVWKSEIEETKKTNKQIAEKQAKKDKRKRKNDFEIYTKEKVIFYLSLYNKKFCLTFLE